MTVNQESLSFGQFVGHKKSFEDVTSEKYDEQFSRHPLDKTIIRQKWQMMKAIISWGSSF